MRQFQHSFLTISQMPENFNQLPELCKARIYLCQCFARDRLMRVLKSADSQDFTADEIALRTDHRRVIAKKWSQAIHAEEQLAEAHRESIERKCAYMDLLRAEQAFRRTFAQFHDVKGLYAQCCGAMDAATIDDEPPSVYLGLSKVKSK